MMANCCRSGMPSGRLRYFPLENPSLTWSDMTNLQQFPSGPRELLRGFLIWPGGP